MNRIIGLLAAAVVLCGVSAQAAEYSTVIHEGSRTALARDIREAALKVCSRAVAQDALGDYGSFDECVENSVHAALARRG